MAAAIGLRDDDDAGALRAAAKRSKDGPQARRQLALAAIYDGATRDAWNKLIDQPWRIMSIGMREWAHRF